MREFKLNLDRLREVIFFPFFECNLSCKGCPVKKPAGEVGLFKSPPDAFESHIEPEHIRRVTEWNVKYFVILGGEPFLSAAFPYMLKMLKGIDIILSEDGQKIVEEITKHSNGKIDVYTNATLLYKVEPSEIKDVLETIDYLSVSVEGDEFWTRKIRGKVFEKCLWVIDKLRDYTEVSVRSGYWHEFACPKCGRTVININGKFYCNNCGIIDKPRYMLEDIVKIVEFFNEKYDVPVGLAPRIDLPPVPRQYMRWFYTTISSMKMVDCMPPSYKNFIGLRITCPAGWNRLVVYPDGSITGCQWRTDVFAHLSMDDDMIVESANSWVNHDRRLMPECYGCKYGKICMSSCKAAMDYKECPVKEYSLDDNPTWVKSFDGRTFVTSKIKAIDNFRNMRLRNPGVC